jgi:predicted transcriptional regulator
MENIDKIRTIGRCTYVINLIDAANAMLNECRFGKDGKMIVSEEADRILKIETELEEISKEVKTLMKTI